MQDMIMMVMMWHATQDPRQATVARVQVQDNRLRATLSQAKIQVKSQVSMSSPHNKSIQMHPSNTR